MEALTAAGALEGVRIGETLPVLANVFLGPPDRTVWVHRGIGVDDELAPPVGDDIDAWELQLYDLFDGNSYGIHRQPWRSQRGSRSWSATASVSLVSTLARWAFSPCACCA